jgi:hypothetical protein
MKCGVLLAFEEEMLFFGISQKLRWLCTFQIPPSPLGWGVMTLFTNIQEEQNILTNGKQTVSLHSHMNFNLPAQTHSRTHVNSKLLPTRSHAPTYLIDNRKHPHTSGHTHPHTNGLSGPPALIHSDPHMYNCADTPTPRQIYTLTSHPSAHTGEMECFSISRGCGKNR